MITGTANADGSLVVPASGIDFAPLTVYSKTLKLYAKVHIIGTAETVGQLDPATGRMELPVKLRFKAKDDPSGALLGDDCYVGTPTDPISLTLSTSGPGGSLYNPATGKVTVSSNSFAIPGATCRGLSSLVNGLLALPGAPGTSKLTLNLAFDPPLRRAGSTSTGPDGGTTSGGAATQKLSLGRKRRVRCYGIRKSRKRHRRRAACRAPSFAEVVTTRPWG